MRRLCRCTLIAFAFLVFSGGMVWAQNNGNITVTDVSALDYNDGGNTMIVQNQGDITKTSGDGYIGQFMIDVEADKDDNYYLKIDVIKPSTPFPFTMSARLRVVAEGAIGEVANCEVRFPIDICAQEDINGFADVSVYGTVSVGDIPAQQYSHDIILQATFTNDTCGGFEHDDPCT